MKAGIRDTLRFTFFFFTFYYVHTELSLFSALTAKVIGKVVNPGLSYSVHSCFYYFLKKTY